MDGTRPDAHPWPDVAGPTHASRPSPEPPSTDPAERRIESTWRFLVVAFALLMLVAIGDVLAGGGRPLALIVAGLVALFGIAVALHGRAVRDLEAGRRAEVESFARILHGLSHSVSADAIVTAIVDDLGEVTGADHTVIVRLRRASGTLEATLAGRGVGGPNATTAFPVSDLDPGAPLVVGAGGRPDQPAAEPARGAGPDPARRVAERIAARVRTVYGLTNTVAAPLEARGVPVGAIVLSRRTAEPWSAAALRLLATAGVEASSALSRIESFRAAETRAATDVLTGLPNRRYFDEYCALLANRRRALDGVGVLMVDIDHFKAINDRHGHDVGDVVLGAVARAIVSAVRDDDVPARYGGEEFAVILRNPTRQVAVDVAERVRRAVGALDLRDQQVSAVSVSVGVAVANGPDEPIDELIGAADRALYQAKRAGRDRVVAA